MPRYDAPASATGLGRPHARRGRVPRLVRSPTKKPAITHRESHAASPAFTIITPAYNAEAWIGAAIGSVVGQTRGDWELLVVDNGSSDGTRAAITPFLDDPRVRLIALEANRLPAELRNEYARTARGDYLVMLDADDSLMPDYLERVAEQFDRDPSVALVATDAHLLNAHSGEPFPFTLMNSKWWRAPRHLPRHRIAEALIRRDFVYAGSAVRRSDFLEIGGLDLALFGCMDWDLWIRIATSGRGVAVLREPLAVYRVHSGSLSRPGTDDLAASLLENVSSMFERHLASGTLGPRETRAARRSLAEVRRHALLAQARASLLADDPHGARSLARTAFATRPGARTLAIIAALHLAPRTVKRRHARRLDEARETGHVIGFGPARRWRR